MVDFGNKLKHLRLQKDMTQAALAEILGVTKSVVSAYENGIRMPSYDILVSISRIFKVSTDYLLGIEKSNVLDLSGLTSEEVKSIQSLVHAIKSRN